jgi:hypothetical protein
MKPLASLTILALACLSAALGAQPVALALSPAELNQMPEEARDHFAHAQQTLFSSPEMSFREITQAAEEAPNVRDLQFMTADFGISLLMGAAPGQGREYVTKILDAYERILDNPEVSERDRSRVYNLLILYYSDVMSPSHTELPNVSLDNARRIREMVQRIERENRPPSLEGQPSTTAPETSEESEQGGRINGG